MASTDALREMYVKNYLLVVVCGQHAPPTSAHVTFIYSEPFRKTFTDQILTQLKN
jgi:hypothetical protein